MSGSYLSCLTGKGIGGETSLHCFYFNNKRTISILSLQLEWNSPPSALETWTFWRSPPPSSDTCQLGLTRRLVKATGASPQPQLLL